MNLLDKRESESGFEYLARLRPDRIRGSAVVNVANALIGASGTMLTDMHFVTAHNGSGTSLSLTDLQDMSKHPLEDLDEQENAYSDVESYLRSLDKDGVIRECLSVLRRCNVLEHTTYMLQQSNAQQRLFYVGMRKQLLENGHSLVEDMDQIELLHYCVELLGGFVHE